MQSRRSFLKKAAIGSGLMMAGSFPFESFAAEEDKKLVILHTNDTHSRLEPFPLDGGKFEGQGGIAARATLIEEIRRAEEQVLLLDAGDIFQGTPYFNLYKGEPEMKALSMMKYDAITMGNHDFDAGVEGFAKQLQHANFPVLVANYDFTDTPLENKTQPYTVIKKNGMKIGVFGLGVELKGLVPDDAYGKTKYLEPIQIANSVANHLKKKEKCDMVICLSHLGYEYDYHKVSDKILAKETDNIDLIIGGHTHTFLEEPTVMKNKSGNEIIINQVGWAASDWGASITVLITKKVPN
ncbi:bifunctional metallophosphatase/5'-nucleotidase [Taibaiella soli]|uniref:bifunctional metallophosphatase/5'-nucleotidase n=1 Tax=Taibaiella soli TaxID=1649169 RepID=UPI001A9CBE0B|nr:metallophosphoesterase [Taibaiella soli]